MLYFTILFRNIFRKNNWFCLNFDTQNQENLCICTKFLMPGYRACLQYFYFLLESDKCFFSSHYSISLISKFYCILYLYSTIFPGYHHPKLPKFIFQNLHSHMLRYDLSFAVRITIFLHMRKQRRRSALQFAVTAKLICAFVFATWIVQFLLNYFLNPKFQVCLAFFCDCTGQFVLDVDRNPNCFLMQQLNFSSSKHVRATNIPLNPTFYIEKQGLQGYTYISYFCSKT